MGRPSEYNKEIAFQICEEISTSAKGLRTICNSKDSYPNASTFLRWVANFSELREQYARAKEMQADMLFDEIIEIADTPQEGVIIKDTPDGVITETADMLGHRKLQIDSRKWVASKLLPKKYGEKVDLTTNGEGISLKIGYGENTDD